MNHNKTMSYWCKEVYRFNNWDPCWNDSFGMWVKESHIDRPDVLHRFLGILSRETTCLNLSGWSCITDDILLYVSRTFWNLEQLNITSHDQSRHSITSDGFSHLATLPNLRRLSVKCIENVTDEEIEKFTNLICLETARNKIFMDTSEKRCPISCFGRMVGLDFPQTWLLNLTVFCVSLCGISII